MSYSFTVIASSKDEAIAKVTAEFDKVVSSQPTHAADQDAAVAAAKAFVALLRQPNEGDVINVTMYGSLSWAHSDKPPSEFTGGNVSVSVSINAK